MTHAASPMPQPERLSVCRWGMRGPRTYTSSGPCNVHAQSKSTTASSSRTRTLERSSDVVCSPSRSPKSRSVSRLARRLSRPLPQVAYRTSRRKELASH
eukprot:321933-Prymnesium_polylepis.2